MNSGYIDTARIISSQKIYGLYGMKHHIVEMRGGVTDAGRPIDQTIRLWNLEADFLNLRTCDASMQYTLSSKGTFPSHHFPLPRLCGARQPHTCLCWCGSGETEIFLGPLLPPLLPNISNFCPKAMGTSQDLPSHDVSMQYELSSNGIFPLQNLLTAPTALTAVYNSPSSNLIGNTWNTWL